MYFRQRTLNKISRPVRPAAQNYTVPASVGGVNALDPLISLPPQDCYYTFNLMPSEYGLRLRRGYREYATGIGTTDTDVRAVIPFQGADPADDKLFASTPDGIYEIDNDGDTSPARVITFSATLNDAGYCTWTEFTTDAGDTYLFVACPQNGIYQYTVSGGWAVPSFTGITESDVAYVVLHKQRLWVVMRGSTDSYYGEVASVAGSFTKFVWGSKFKYGGKLLGMWNWTLDGGDGVDDYLVGISRGGDVLCYRGSDPSAADWGITGSFFVGEMPDSRRCVQAYAGELFILSTFGVTSLRDLVSGVDASDTKKSPSANINRIIRQAVIGKKDNPGWQLTSYPSDGFLQILEPWANEVDAIQYSQNLLTKAWGYWRNVPAICGETWQGDYFLGSTGGRLFIYDGNFDNSTIAGGLGDAIEFSILTSFQAVGDHATYKRVGMIRVVSTSTGRQSFNLKAVYDYDVRAEADAPSGAGTTDASVWNVALWDAAIWSGALTGNSSIEGAAGIGRTVAVAMRGEAISRLTIVGWDLTITSGGFL